MTRFAAAVPLAALALMAVPPPAPAAWRWPLRGEVVTEFHNGDDPYAAGQHRGIDIAGSVGAPVLAATAGLVRFAGTAGSSGTTVSVRSADGVFDLSYLHLGSLAVRRGQQVSAGQTLGRVGTTGVRSVERPHLHFGVRSAGTRHDYLDPLTLLPPAAVPAPRAPQAVPVAAPVPVRPSPAPAPVPVARPHSPGLRAPEPAPARRPSPRPLPAPGRVSAPEPVAVARPHLAAAARPARAAAERHQGMEPARQGPARLGAVPRPRAAAAGPGPARAASPTPGHGGADLGWIAACAGLVGAALALTGGASSPGSWRPSGARLAALLPAFAGRGPRTRE